MLRYLLDTNVVVALLRGPAEDLNRRLRQHEPAEVGVSSISMHELYYGACRSERTEHNLALVDGMLLQVVDFDSDDARESGAIRADLAARGTPIGPYDILIAGQARGRGLTLVTANTAEFQRVPDLAMEDWTS
ncbi:MAG TPA: type II toxin-antitoxin system VapC family toxin [Longimicrobiales bacterium]|nr:type II toxin-antitoxin system VapC family toxin [Longimicrobiales bacterium]